MHIEFLVEEPSAEAALLNILPKVLQPITSFAIHPYQGKRDLLKKLPSRFRGYKTWLPKDWRIVVLIDTDDEDCRQLIAWLSEFPPVPSSVWGTEILKTPGWSPLHNLAIEELE